MTVDPAWEAAHAARAWGKYPHPAAVEFVGRHYGIVDDGTVQRGCAIDLGCGAGASAIFLAHEGFDVVAVDGSMSAINRAIDRMTREPSWMAPRVRLFYTDVALFAAPSEFYDVVFDICCLSCLSLVDAGHMIDRALGWLKPGGRMLSVMAADDCDPAVHGEFKVRQIGRDVVDGLFAGFSDVFVGKHTRLTRRGFISEWVVEAQK